MAYVIQAEIQTAIPATHLTDALDDNGDGSADAGLLDQIIATASNAVDAYLSGLFEVPFGDPPAPVKEAAFVFACELIYARRQERDERNPWKARADYWRDRLQKIGNGELPLDLNAVNQVNFGIVTDNVAVDGSSL